MKKLVKSYHVFLPYVWERWLLYLVYPLCLVLVNVGMVKNGIPPEICVMLCSSLIVAVELFADLLVFGGIAAKDTNKLEYLKTSAKGLGVLQSSIIGDAIRRLFSVTVILMAYCLMDSTIFTAHRQMMCVFSTLFLVELGLIVSRSFSHLSVVMATSACLEMLATPLTAVVLSNVMAGVICPVLYVIVLIVGRMRIMKKARKSYYDGRD